MVVVAVVVVIVDVDAEEGEGGGEDAQRRKSFVWHMESSTSTCMAVPRCTCTGVCAHGC